MILTVERLTSKQFASVWELHERFQENQRVFFTNFTSMAIMGEREIKSVNEEALGVIPDKCDKI